MRIELVFQFFNQLRYIWPVDSAQVDDDRTVASIEITLVEWFDYELEDIATDIMGQVEERKRAESVKMVSNDWEVTILSAMSNGS